MAREFTVFPVVNGWVVKVGCSMFAYTDRLTLHGDILEYLTDPDKKEHEMLDRFVRPKNPVGPTMDECAKMPAVGGLAESAGPGLERLLRR